MVTVLLIMFAGMIFGYIFRNKDKVIKPAEPLLTYSIYLLLLLIGISVGLNKMVVEKLDTIGIQSLVLSFSGILGSCIASYFCYIIFFKNKEEK